jgi:hypothetical protein
MRKLVISVALAVFVSSSAFARSNSPQPRRIARAQIESLVQTSQSASGVRAKSQPPASCEEVVLAAKDKVARKLLKKLKKAKTATKLASTLLSYELSGADASADFLGCVTRVTGVTPVSSPSQPRASETPRVGRAQSLGTCKAGFTSALDVAASSFHANLASDVGQPTNVRVVGATESLATLDRDVGAATRTLATCLSPVAFPPAPLSAARRSAVTVDEGAIKACADRIDANVGSATDAYLARVDQINASTEPVERRSLAVGHASLDAQRVSAPALGDAATCVGSAAKSSTVGAVVPDVTNNVPPPSTCPPQCAPPVPSKPTLADALAKCQADLQSLKAAQKKDLGQFIVDILALAHADADPGLIIMVAVYYYISVQIDATRAHAKCVSDAYRRVTMGTVVT